MISAALVLLTASEVLAAPQASGTLLPLPTVCTTPSYGPFKLFARRVLSDSASTVVDYPIRLLSDGGKVAISHMIVDTNAVRIWTPLSLMISCAFADLY